MTSLITNQVKIRSLFRSGLPRYRQPVRLLAAVLILLFVQVQLASIEHSTAHPFHKHELSCTLLQAAEKNTLDMPALGFVLASLYRVIPGLACSHMQSVLNHSSHYLSRAPPVR